MVARRKSAATAAKRADEELYYNDFKQKGAIVRIKLENFVTYDDCELFPGPHLNVVLGPNGSGKSTLVCAICLGLGGEPPMLGRAKDISEYVKHCPAPMGFVEIELFGGVGGENIIIRREIYKETNKSEWFINARRASKQAVTKIVVEECKIDLSNMCQLLPQDRVMEFAKLNDIDRLIATEKAIDKNENKLYDKHVALIDYHKKMKSAENDLIIYKEELETMVKKNQQIKSDVEKYIKKQAHLSNIENLELKRKWVDYEKSRELYITTKPKKAEIQARLKEAKALVTPNTRKIKNLDDLAESLVKERKNRQQEAKAKKQELNRYEKKVETAENSLEAVINDFTEFKKERTLAETKLKKLRDDVARSEEQLANMESVETRKEELKCKNEELATLQENNSTTEDMEDLKGRIKDTQHNVHTHQRALAELDNMEARRMKGLMDHPKFGAAAAKLVEWMRNTENTGFNAEVSEPMILQLDCPNPKARIYVESAIVAWQWTAFICVDRADMSKVTTKAREMNFGKLGIASIPYDKTLQDFLNERPIAEKDYANYGIDGFLIDFVDASDIIKSFLCSSGFHKVAVLFKDGGVDTAERLYREHGIQRCLSGTKEYRFLKSKYGQRNVVTTTGDIRFSKHRNLCDKVDPQMKDRALEAYRKATEECNRLNEDLRELEKQGKERDKEKLQLRKCIENIKKEINGEKQMRQQVKAKKSKLASQEKKYAALGDYEDEQAKSKKLVNSEFTKWVQLLKRIGDRCNEVADNAIIMERLKQKMETIKAEKLELEREEIEQRQRLEALEQELEEIVREVSNLKKIAKTKLNLAETATGKERMGQDKENLLCPQLSQLFETLPDTLEEIDCKVAEEEGAAACIGDINEDVAQEHQRRSMKIESFKVKVADQEALVQDGDAKMGEMKNDWLGPLESLVHEVGNAFGKFFNELGYVGAVELHKDPDGDFAKYALDIKVMFRSGAKGNTLQKLRGQTQSGGEKAVSTVLFLMSIQSLARYPFRVVDEVNQGMDPKNERNVFKQIVYHASQENTPQYFLITPKLLSGLKYNRRTTIMVVYNGYFMLPHTEFRPRTLY